MSRVGAIRVSRRSTGSSPTLVRSPVDGLPPRRGHSVQEACTGRRARRPHDPHGEPLRGLLLVGSHPLQGAQLSRHQPPRHLCRGQGSSPHACGQRPPPLHEGRRGALPRGPAEPPFRRPPESDLGRHGHVHGRAFRGACLGRPAGSRQQRLYRRVALRGKRRPDCHALGRSFSSDVSPVVDGGSRDTDDRPRGQDLLVREESRLPLPGRDESRWRHLHGRRRSQPQSGPRARRRTPSP